jgi:hypothetical protein
MTENEQEITADQIWWGETADTLLRSACDKLLDLPNLPKHVRGALVYSTNMGKNYWAVEVKTSGTWEQGDTKYMVYYERKLHPFGNPEDHKIGVKEDLGLWSETAERQFACAIWADDVKHANNSRIGEIFSTKSKAGLGTSFRNNNTDAAMAMEELINSLH